MKNRDDVLAAIAVTILLVLTAWGNATAMIVVSAIGFVVGLGVLRGRTQRGGLVVAMAGFAVAATIAIVMTMTLSRGH